MSKYLINEYPVHVLPTLAAKIGLNEAIALQQLHFWLQASKNKRDGHYWVFNRYDDWQKQFPWWSVSSIKRIFTKLERLGFVTSTNKYNKNKIDRTKWYRIDYEKLESLTTGQSDLSQLREEDTTGQSDPTTGQSDDTTGQSDDTTGQSDPLHRGGQSDPLKPEVPTENTTTDPPATGGLSLSASLNFELQKLGASSEDARAMIQKYGLEAVDLQIQRLEYSLHRKPGSIRSKIGWLWKSLSLPFPGSNIPEGFVSRQELERREKQRVGENQRVQKKIQEASDAVTADLQHRQQLMALLVSLNDKTRASITAAAEQALLQISENHYRNYLNQKEEGFVLERMDAMTRMAFVEAQLDVLRSLVEEGKHKLPELEPQKASV